MIKLGVVMDPIETISYKKDSTLAMLWEAQARHYALYYFEQKDLFLRDGVAFGHAQHLSVSRDSLQWFAFQGEERIPLASLDVILMRKNPPFNEEYIYTTYLLEHAKSAGTLIVNDPQSLRDANEKFFATLFPQCCPPTIVTSSISELKKFRDEMDGEIICKPLNGMGGESVFHISAHDRNANVIFATLTHGGTRYIMAQRFIKEIVAGDKRILVIDGDVFPYALARIPGKEDWRGNLALGAEGIVQKLSEKDAWIGAEVGPTLRARGLYFVGLDVIGDYLTEINVTSPTGIRELDAALGENISRLLFDCIEKHLILR